MSFDFLYNFVWNISHYTKNSAKYYHKYIHTSYVRLNAKYLSFLLDFNDTCILSTGFEKNSQYPISWKSIQWKTNCSMQKDGRTDKQDDKANIRSQQFCKCLEKAHCDLLGYDTVYSGKCLPTFQRSILPSFILRSPKLQRRVVW